MTHWPCAALHQRCSHNALQPLGLWASVCRDDAKFSGWHIALAEGFLSCIGVPHSHILFVIHGTQLDGLPGPLGSQETKLAWQPPWCPGHDWLEVPFGDWCRSCTHGAKSIQHAGAAAAVAYSVTGHMTMGGEVCLWL